MIKKGGRLKKLTTREEKYLVSKFVLGNAQTITNGKVITQDKFNKSISNSSVKRVLFKNGMKSYRKSKKPFISKANIRKRKEYYDNIHDFTYQDWKKIIFTDESRYCLLNVNGDRTYYKNI